jgi:AAA+ superfamily predicted ATPase
MDPKKELELLIRAKTPIIYIRSYEEDRVKVFLDNLVERLKKEPGVESKYLAEWTQDKGLMIFDTHKSAMSLVEQAYNEHAKRVYVPGGLSYLSTLPQTNNALVVAYDLHLMCLPSEIPVVNRYLKDLARNYRKDQVASNEAAYNTFIIVSATYEIPRELEKEIEVLDFPPPDYDELGTILSERIEYFKERSEPNLAKRSKSLEKQKELYPLLCRAGQGLISTEFGLAVNKMIVSDYPIDNDCADIILLEKQQIIQKSEILEYYPPSYTYEDVGGLENFKNWLADREFIIQTRAWENPKTGIPVPKGVLIVGASGGGKSLMAKATAGAWKIPLLRLDMGKVFSKYVGESERRITDALTLAENMAPCILWLDEIEKGMAGAGGSGDSGVGARIFGSFLTWMQEKTKPVFMIATANSIRLFIEKFPEFLRKGRFDNVFFLDLPNPVERKAILKIHLGRFIGHITKDDKILNNDDVEKLLQTELDEVEDAIGRRMAPPTNLIGSTDQFTGAEIEYAINDVAITTYAKAQDSEYKIKFQTIVEYFKTIKPMYNLKGTSIDTTEVAKAFERTREQAKLYGESASKSLVEE